MNELSSVAIFGMQTLYLIYLMCFDFFPTLNNLYNFKICIIGTSIQAYN